MDKNKLIQILKYFQKIKPDKDFAARSRRDVLLSQKIDHRISVIKTGLLNSFKFSGALMLASLMIFVIFGGLTFFNIKNLSPVMLTSFNDNKLMAESGKVEIEIKLKEVEYYERSAREVATLLNEIIKEEENAL